MSLLSLFSLLFSLWTCLPWMQTAAVAQTSAVSSSLAPAQSDKVPQGVVCAATDAAEVQRLLSDKSLKTPLDFARKFLGRPYVAATLEVADPEQVVVNLQGLDCATLVETSQALAMTRREGKTDVASYIRNLEKIRYFDGKNRGYTSRLHYLSFWMADLTKRKVAKEVVLPQTLTLPLEIRLNYMSTHANALSMGNPFQIILQSALVGNHMFALARGVEHVEFPIIAPKSNALVRIIQACFLCHHRDDVTILDSSKLFARQTGIRLGEISTHLTGVFAL